jgi:proline iminopeptidase
MMSVAREGYVPLDNARLFYREIGQGQPIILLHGGPDFDHTYLLPDMDRLADSYRLIYYDQRGRGRSTGQIQPEEISLKTEMEDLNRLMRHLHLASAAVLGHSWGGVLAMKYAIQHPERVSHLILLNTAAASYQDYLILRQEVLRRKAVYADEINAITSSAAYQAGDPDAVTAYYRIHFQVTIKRSEHLEQVLNSMRGTFIPEIILQSRAIEDQLYTETWLYEQYDLFPGLKQLHTPTLVVHGDYDFIPAKCARHIADAIPGARFRLLKDCGHFAYVEAPDDFRNEIDDFTGG